MGRLDGKVAIITGGAKGLGEADTLLFVREGAKVIVTDVDVENGERVAAACPPGSARFVRQDVRDEEAWKSLIAGVLEQEGRLDILVNNAGVVEMGTIESTSAEAYRFVMAVSVDGTFFGCKYAIPAMQKSGGGSIINMGSVASLQGEYMVTAYCAAKGAVESLTRAVAVYCAQTRLNIRCNSLHPAGIETPMVYSIPGKLAALGFQPPDSSKASLTSPLGVPNDVAYAALYLASDESRFISGQRIVIDNTMSVTSGTVPGDGEIMADEH